MSFNLPSLKKLLTSKHAALAVILLVSSGVYFNALFNEFVYDDLYLVLENPWIRDIGYIPEIFTQGLWSFSPKLINYPENYYRPLVHVIYMTDYHIFGLEPWGYHLTKILFHAGASILVFFLASTILRKYKGYENPLGHETRYSYLPFLAAILFSVHPVHTEVVTVGTADVSFAFFYLLSFYLYIKKDVPVGKEFISSVIFFFLAALCKETALTLLPLIFLYDYTARRSRTPSEWLGIYLPYLFMAGLYMGLRIYALGGIAPGGGPHELTGFQYLINIFPLFVQYLYKLILPVNLQAFYVFEPVYSIFELKTIAAIGISLVFSWFIYKTGRKNGLLCFALLLILIPLLPVLCVPGLSENAFSERYLYLSSVGFVIILSCVLAAMAGSNYRYTKALTLFITGLIVILYSAGTINRNRVWSDEFTFWTDTVKKAPESSRAHNNLGNALYKKGFIEEAIKEYKEALRIKPGNQEALYNLGAVYHHKGMLDEAISFYKKAVQLNPYYFLARSNLGVAYAEKGEYDRAIRELKGAVKLWPDAEGYYNLGLLYQRKGRNDLAVREFENALKINPDFIPAKEALKKIKEFRKIK
jgi:tetratricopeptide (TPR) repeat protein